MDLFEAIRQANRSKYRYTKKIGLKPGNNKEYICKSGEPVNIECLKKEIQGVGVKVFYYIHLQSGQKIGPAVQAEVLKFINTK
jgi:23S rRNA A1618 N6-methylase RlmF